MEGVNHEQSGIAVSIGIREDTVIATILLHDVCADCGVSLAELPVSDTVKRKKCG